MVFNVLTKVLEWLYSLAYTLFTFTIGAGEVIIFCPDRVYRISRRGRLTDTLIETIIKNKNK